MKQLRRGCSWTSAEVTLQAPHHVAVVDAGLEGLQGLLGRMLSKVRVAACAQAPSGV